VPLALRRAAPDVCRFLPVTFATAAWLVLGVVAVGLLAGITAVAVGATR
jgi:hypothetical protein